MQHATQFIAILLTFSCGSQESKVHSTPQYIYPQIVDTISYEQLKNNVSEKRKMFYKENANLQDQKNLSILQDFWINTLLNDFYPKWANTPWDYNGITQQPGVGSIACGYFVTTLLRDMDVNIQRVKLAICPSSQMMTSLVPGQKLMNLSSLSFKDFNERISHFGKGVYVIGLDFHTGFIINDGTENWFLHSNYIDRQGVVKESLLQSRALKASKTRWMISLTSDIDLLTRWMKS